MSEKIRLNLSANKKEFNSLKDKMHITSNQELFNTAFTLLKWCIKEKEGGAMIGSFRREEDEIPFKEIGLLGLDRVQPL